jgi:hypothetical protein
MTRRSRAARRYPAINIINKHPQHTQTQLAELLDISTASIVRWKTTNCTLTEWECDKYAIKLGLHPGNIWPNWFDIPLTQDNWRHANTD